jgi:RNA polymerase sigma-70 factor, ECF subfamily
MITQALCLPVPTRSGENARVTDDDLLRERFGILFRQSYPELCSFVVQFVRSGAVAEELVQDLFLRLWERRAEWETELPSRSYLYQSARNRALDHLRHERIVQQTASRSAAEMEAERTETVPNTDLATQELDLAIRRAIEQLPDRTRQVFVLSRGHGLRYGQIADALGISVKTVEAQMGRALRILRDRLRGYL